MYRTLAPSEKQTNKKDQLHNLYHQKELEKKKKELGEKMKKPLTNYLHHNYIHYLHINTMVSTLSSDYNCTIRWLIQQIILHCNSYLRLCISLTINTVTIAFFPSDKKFAAI